MKITFMGSRAVFCWLGDMFPGTVAMSAVGSLSKFVIGLRLDPNTSLVPRLFRNTNMYHLHNFNVHVLEYGSLE